MPPPSRRVAVVVALLASAAALICAIGWYGARRVTPALERLTSEERQALAAELAVLSPGVHQTAWFEPEIGYTLHPDAEIEAWDDRFTTNELGYRTGPVPKPPGTFRVVFVGDSWTFGLGVSEYASLPAVFGRMADRHAGRSVEAWTLALPGYNVKAGLAALWFFFDRLQPDAVVICPMSNDHDSIGRVLPNGSLTTYGVRKDEFGDVHSVRYRLLHVDSYRFRARWRANFDTLLDAERRLRQRNVPLLLWFAGRWDEPFVHHHMAQAGLTTPYLVAPRAYTAPAWRNPPPWGHANPIANRVFGRMVYDAMAQLLAWPRLAGEDRSVEGPDGEPVNVPMLTPHRRAPAGSWAALTEKLLIDATIERIPERYEPSGKAQAQFAGPGDADTGLMRRAGTILVRRPEGARKLAVTLRGVEGAPSLYPLEVTVSIPSPSGGTRAVGVLGLAALDGSLSAADGSLRARIECPLPDDVPVGAALDVVLQAQRTATLPDRPGAHAFYVESIEPL